MSTFSKTRIFWISLLSVILICIFFADSLFDSAVRKTVSIAVNSINAKKELNLSVADVNFSLTEGTISLKGIKMVPDSLYYQKFQNGDITNRILTAVEITDIELTGLSVISIFLDGRMDSVTISVKNVVTNIYLREKETEGLLASRKASRGVLDSLRLKGLKSVSLGAVKVIDYRINLLNAETLDTITSVLGDYVELDGLDFEKRSDGSDIFELQTEKLEVALKNQRLKLPKREHEIKLGSLKFKNADETLNLVDFSYLPNGSLEQIASKRRYSDNLIDMRIKKLNVYGLSINSFQKDHLASVEKVSIDSMHLNLFKNKQKPDDVNKRPLMPQQILKKLKVPIHIGEIVVENSSLTYTEIQPKNPKDIVVANMTDLNVNINYITSVKDSLASGKPLTVTVSTLALGQTKADISITMPYNRNDDAFHYKGIIGSAHLKTFNPVILPVAHVEIARGEMQSMHFSVNATPTHAEGQLTMLYSDLHVDVPLKRKQVEHALSFLAGSAIHENNPRKKGKVHIAEIDCDRIPFNGFGGFMVKSVLKGVKNSVQIFGKQHHQPKNRAKSKNKKESKKH